MLWQNKVQRYRCRVYWCKLLYKHNRTPQGFLHKRLPVPSPNDTGWRSVGKVRQNNMTLQMNIMFLKVLKEVLLGLPITKLNVKKKDRIRRGRRIGILKRISAWSRFALRCHSAVYQGGERERVRERERTQSQPNIGMKGYICIKNASTCDVQNSKCIMGKNLIQTYQHTFHNNQSHI